MKLLVLTESARGNQIWKRSRAAFFAALFVLVGGSIFLGGRSDTAEAAQSVSHCTPNVVSYDIVYVRAPRFGNATDTIWPEVTRPLNADPGADLRLLHPNCTEEVLFPLAQHQSLVDAPIGNGVVLDPNVSFDGQWVVFAYLHDQSTVNPQRNLSYKGADIYRLNLLTRETIRLTFQEFTPNTGNGAQFTNCGQSGQGQNCPNVGVFNVGPAFVAQGDVARPAIVFTSSRNNFVPPKQQGGQQRALQLFLMDWQGKNVRQIGYLNQSLALHPLQLLDGRLVFTSWENQGIRDGRQFNLWFINPDGTKWHSASGFGENAIVHHFMTQMSNQDIVTVRYYNQNNNGFGDLARYPLDPAGPDFLPINDPDSYMPFQRKGQLDLTNWTDSVGSLADDFPAPCTVGANIYNDISNPCPSANRIGKVTHPAAAPEGNLVLVYTKGAANSNHIYTNQGINQPFYDGGLYLMPSGKAADGTASPTDLVRILNNPNYNEQWPRPVAPYNALFPGKTQPAVLSQIQNNGAEAALTPNTPLGLVGASSLIWRDTDARLAGYNYNNDNSIDPDPFNASHEMLYAWVHEGADAGLYTDNDIYAIRILGMIPKTDKSYPNTSLGFFNHGDERLRILGEIPVRHEGVIDQQGNVDTSFLARIPADTPITFQTLDRNGMVLNMAQTWHQVRPGEGRYDCGGCHAHTKEPLDFHTTVAGQAGFQPAELAAHTPLLHVTQRNGNPATTTLNTPQVTVEYFRDVRPILTQRCSGCHQDNTTDGKLNLHDDATQMQCGWSTWPGTYYRLAIDRFMDGCPQFGLGVPTDAPAPYFIEPQLTRYMRGYQSRQSLLLWKVFGARLDGRTNTTRDGDIDYDPAADAIHPNLGALRGLTWDEKLTLARWVDLGAPIQFDTTWGWLEDDLRPTLWVSPTLEQAQTGAVNKVTVGAYDLESGLAPHTLKVLFNVPIGGQPAGTNFANSLSLSNGGVLTVPLPAQIDLAASQAELTVQIQDNAGQLTEVVRTFGGSSGGGGGGGGKPLRLTVTRQGRGTVTSNPAGIICPSDCKENYPSGTPVTLTAAPANGWTFSEWKGACSGSSACVVPMTQKQSVKARFVRNR